MGRQLNTETSRSFGSPNSGTILPFRGDQRSFSGAEYRRLTILFGLPGGVELDVLADALDLKDGFLGPADLRYFTHFWSFSFACS